MLFDLPFSTHFACNRFSFKNKYGPVEIGGLWAKMLFGKQKNNSKTTKFLMNKGLVIL